MMCRSSVEGSTAILRRAGEREGDLGFGDSPPIAGIQTTLMPKIMKALGAEKVAALGNARRRRRRECEELMQYAVPAVGLSPCTRTPRSTSALPMSARWHSGSRRGCGQCVLRHGSVHEPALAQALGQNGVKMKAEIMATGYGQPLLDQPASKSLGLEVVLVSLWAPVEIQSKATRRFQADLKKYAGYTGVPDFGVYTGYITCDLAILGLQRQGDHLNPSTFSDDLRSVGQFNRGVGSAAQREPQSRNLREARGCERR